MKPLPRLLPLLALTFAASVAQAGQPARPPHRYQTPAPADAPAAGVQQRVLPNGLRVLVRARHRAPVVTTMMWYRVGARDEMPGATGIAHFLEHLMFKGTRKLAKGAIDRLTYQNGGTNNAFTYYDYTAFQFDFPRQSWKSALRIEADRMRNCAFDRQEFEAERQVVMEERRGRLDDPDQQFGEQLNAMAYTVLPYRNPVIGWMEDLKRLTRDQVYAFYQRYYVPANATLVITGDVQPEDAFAAARAAFSAVPRLPAPARPALAEPAAPGARRLRLALSTQVPRVEVIFRTPNRRSPDVYALHVLAYALTEGRLSRLYRRLVETERLAADVDSGLEVYRDAGMLSVEANAKAGASLEKLESAMWEELERVRTEPLSGAELERAKNQFAADWIQGVDTAGDLATVIGEADSLGGHAYLDTLLARVQAVTTADVQRVASIYLQRGRSVLGFLEPRAGRGEGSGERGEERVDRYRRAGAWNRRAFRTARRSVKSAHASPRSPRPAPLFATLKPVEKRLPNGMRLLLLENHDLPSVTLSTRIDAGSYDESDARAGLANFVARMLDQGTGNRSHEEISRALEQVGASFSTTAGRPVTYIHLQSLSRYLAGLLPLYAELLRAPSFPQDRLDQERSRLLVEIKEGEDDAETVAENAFYDLVYAPHPAHRPVEGTEATVRALDRQMLAEFHRRFYRPGNMTLVAVGDFRAPELLSALTSVFEDWNPGPPPERPPLPELTRQTDLRNRRVTMDRAQTQIILGHLGVPRTSPDFVALKVMDTILGEGVGGGFTARIPYQLRDIQGLAYTVGSSITGSAGKQPGVFWALLGTEPAREKQATQALLREIRRIRSSPVTETELAEAVNYLASSYVFDFQTNSQLADYLQLVTYYDLGFNYRRQFVEQVRRVTRPDVLRAARRYLDPDHYTLVVVGPGEKTGK